MKTKKVKAHVTEHDEDDNLIIDRKVEFILDTFRNEEGEIELDGWDVEEEMTEEEYSAVRLWADDFGHMKEICDKLGIKYI